MFLLTFQVYQLSISESVFDSSMQIIRALTAILVMQLSCDCWRFRDSLSGTETSSLSVLTKFSLSLCSLPLYIASSSTSEAFVFTKVFLYLYLKSPSRLHHPALHPASQRQPLHQEPNIIFGFVCWDARV